MKTIEALELDNADFTSLLSLTPEAQSAMSHAETVFYHGELVKNRNGRITKVLNNKRAEESQG